jgi:negative regulator of flagellin synthesis FlgM
MIDPVSGISAGGVTRVATTIAPTAPVAPVRTVASETPEAPRALASALAESPPVDADRVAMIKRAIANGTFPILPAKIADRLLALKLEWNPRDQA